MIDKIKRIKLSRLKPHELYLNSVFDDLNEHYYRTTHIFYENNDEITYFKFEISTNNMYVDKRIYSVYNYGIHYLQMNLSICEYFKKYFNIDIKYITPYTNIGKDIKNEHLIL